MRFANDVVIVTGGAQGIGLAISTAFLGEGARVVVADIDEEAGQETLAYLKTISPQVTYVHMDVAKEEQVKSLIDFTLKNFGRIDVLINNAGIGDNRSLFDRPMEAWDRVMAVNLRGPYMMAKYAGKALIESGHGAIISLASTRALMSEADTEPYSASKGGILALTHSLAVSLGPAVRVNAISPGWIEVCDGQKSAKKVQPHHRPADLSQHPAGRVGTPEDIANACLFLASKEAGFITGQNVVIDGGMTIKMIYEP